MDRNKEPLRPTLELLVDDTRVGWVLTVNGERGEPQPFEFLVAQMEDAVLRWRE